MKNDRGIISYSVLVPAIAGLLFVLGGSFAAFPNQALANNDSSGFEVFGGGALGSDPLYISNEKIQVFGSGTAVTITWDTNVSATSRVAFGTTSIKVLTLDDTFGYGTTTALYALTTKSHTVTIENLAPGATYYFRPSSKRDAGTNERTLGIELLTTPTVATPVIPTVPAPLHATPTTNGTGECFEYLRAFIRFGANNDSVEVLKLQSFLRTFEGAKDVPISGTYDAVTRDALNEFQEKYRDDVLTPWGLKVSTGYVYITTKHHINKVYCSYKQDFALTLAQKAEINAYRDEIERLKVQGINVSVAAFEPVTIRTGVKEPQESAWGVEEQVVHDKENTAREAIGTSSEDTTSAVIEAFKNSLTNSTESEDPASTTAEKEGRLAKIAATITSKIHPSKWIQLLLILVLFIVGFLLYRSGSKQKDNDDNDIPTFGKSTTLPPVVPLKKEEQHSIYNDFNTKNNSGPEISNNNRVSKDKTESIQQSRATLEQLKDNLVLKREEAPVKNSVAEEKVIQL